MLTFYPWLWADNPAYTTLRKQRGEIAESLLKSTKKKKENKTQTPTPCLDHSNSASVADTFPLGNQAESSILRESWCIYLSEGKS